MADRNNTTEEKFHQDVSAEPAAQEHVAASQAQEGRDDATLGNPVDSTPATAASVTQMDTTPGKEDDMTLGLRQRKPSARVSDEDTQRETMLRLKRIRAGHAADVTRKHSDLKCTLNQNTIEETYIKLERLREAFTSFDDAHLRYMDLALKLDPNEAQDHHEHHKMLLKSIQDAEYDVKTHIPPPLQDPSMGVKDLGALRGSGGSCKGSVCGSYRSDGSTSSARAKAASRRAALQAKAEALEQQQALENDLHRKKMVLERLKLDGELRAAAAEEETLARFMEEPDWIPFPVVKQELNTHANEFVPGEAGYAVGSLHMSATRNMRHTGKGGTGQHMSVRDQQVSAGGQHTNMGAMGGQQHNINKGPADQHRYTKQESAGQPYRSRDGHAAPPLSDNNPFWDLADAFRSMTMSGRLPAPEPAVFTGDPLRYADWEASFQSLIHQNSVRLEERMHYLKKYLAGPAKEAVEGYFLTASPQAYDEARALLKRRFGTPFVVSNAFKKKLEGWPKIGPRDHNGLRRFADFLHQCTAAMDSYGSLATLDTEMENARIITKLPERLVFQWNRISFDYQEQHGRFPPFKEFQRFVTQESEVACNPLLIQTLAEQQPEKTKAPRSNQGSRALATKQVESPKKTSPSNTTKTQGDKETVRRKFDESKEVKYQPRPCICCKGIHYMDECSVFAEMSTKDKGIFIEDKKLCLACLKRGHFAKDCRRRAFCKVCSKRHPTPLHPDEQQEVAERKPMSTTNKDTIISLVARSKMSQAEKSTMIVPVYISHVDRPEETLVYALLDSQSDTTFLSQKTYDYLKVRGVKTSLLLSTMTTVNTKIQSMKVNGLQVRGIGSDLQLKLPAAFTRKAIPVNRSHIPTPEMAQRWPHLEHLASKLVPLQEADVGTLIGYDCAQALIPREVVTSPGNGPFAQRTDLGWGIIGLIDPSQVSEDVDEVGCSYHVLTRDVQDSHCHRTQVHFVHRTTVKEEFLPVDVLQRLEGDVYDGEGAAMSYEDKLFLEGMAVGIHRRKDGHYEMPLPLKPEVQLPNNRPVALKRLELLKKRLQRDDKLRQDYTKFMSDMIDKGYAEKIPEEELNTKEGNVWYIPHHGVYHTKKPNKIRVVFDASAQFRGASLNNNLLKGPDLANTLIGILCRFRQEPIAVTCDVEQMFFQFGVNQEHRDLLRFLWWEEGEADPTEYRMTVHLFGATSSPGCANFGLKQCAKDFESKYGSDVADFVRNNFYVDDGLKSLPTVQQAVDLLSSVKEMCSEVGIHLHKFTSNSKQVLKSIPKEDRAPSLQNVDLLKEIIPVEGALGISWCLELDTFQFRIELQDKPLTRRGILSTVSSIYDPLGFVAPVVLIGKRILQDMCKQNAGWDEPLPEDLRARWEKWRSDLSELERIDIQRCYKPRDFKECVKMELHHFADASYEGYGQCTYLRQMDAEGRVWCSFVKGKARVAPMKLMTIPRLELTAAVESVKTSKFLQKELCLGAMEVFWSDSTVVLGYLKNDARRFHVFVANRVQAVREHTHPKQWHHVVGEDNPADEGSRGLYASEMSQARWLVGPKFLWNKDFEVQEEPMLPLSEDDPEVRAVHAVSTKEDAEAQENTPLHLDHLSSWNCAKRAVANCRRVAKKWSQRVRSRKHVNSDVGVGSKPGVEELKEAEILILKSAQQEAFPEEVRSLQSTEGTVSGRSPLSKLDPYMDKEGLLRVGGRIRSSDMSMEVKHPIVLPRKGHITMLVIRDCHERVLHQGRGITTNKIRSRGFWIIGCSSAVSSYIFRCVMCRKLRTKPQEQKMADLPTDRMEEAPPFTYCGVDCFGPFIVRQGRKDFKRYGVLFTCLASRAIHIEVADTLTTDSFINALRRMISLRGPIKLLRSDQGTNFVGAKSELQPASDEIDTKRIEDFLSSNGGELQFCMNVPHASHMGGVWERMIRSARNVLSTLLQSVGTQLNDEALRTFMYEAAAVVNSRPLTTDTLYDPTSLKPLCPNDLLTMKTEVSLPPPGHFPKEDLYSRKYWRRVQHLANVFWQRWRKEYIQTLQQRQKWTSHRRDIEVGDVVLIKDDLEPRGCWRLARVEETYASQDDHVRKVKLAVGSRNLDKKGRRTSEVTYLERPIQKLVLVVEADKN